ncbi:MAG TPA: DUF5683 domain-containing protein [Chitinophagaceae bacterium]|nr:DUF5683 domain-containing protein [Chitinophagaceae bacterium]
MKKIRCFFLLAALLFTALCTNAQKTDSSRQTVQRADSGTVKLAVKDTSTKKKHSPRKATIRSAIIPGWGQAYNRSYWKIPVVYAALGITGAIFNYNRVQYNKVKYAYFYVINRNTADSSKFDINKVDPALRAQAELGNSYYLQTYRNEFRKDLDYSVLFFIFFWALNVVDATVDGHLKDFDVSNDLSLKIKPNFNALPNTLGLSMVFTIGKHPVKHSTYQLP